MINMIKIGSLINLLAVKEEALELVSGTFLDDIMRNLCFALDKMIYSWISFFYKVFMILAEVISEFSDAEVIKDVKNRIMLIVALYMMFILLFHFLKMVVEPDLISDKEKGVGKILVRIFISFGLLISINLIFESAYKIQDLIISNGVVHNIMLGNEGYYDLEETFPMIIFNKLFYPDPILQSDQYKAGCPLRDPIQEDQEPGIIVSAQYIAHYLPEVNMKYRSGTSFTDTYCYTYYYGISTVTGLIICFLFLTFSVDLGVRIAKLLFMQLISPVPILSYIRPGDQILMNWAKDTISIYLDVFIRLLIIDFVAILAELIGDSLDNLDFSQFLGENSLFNENAIKGFVIVFIWIGAFMFAKKSPDVIKKIFGIQGEGNLHFKGWGRVLGFGGGIATGAAVGLAGGGIGGLLSGIGRGTLGGFTGKKSRDIAGIMRDRNIYRNNLRSSGVSGAEVAAHRMGQRLGIPSQAETQDRKMSQYKSTLQNVEAMEKRAEEQAIKNNDLVRFQNSDGANVHMGFGRLAARHDTIMKDTTGQYTSGDKMRIEKDYKSARQQAIANHITNVASGVKTDVKISGYINATNNDIKENSDLPGYKGKSIIDSKMTAEQYVTQDYKDTIEKASIGLETSTEFGRAHTVQNVAGGGKK